MADDVTIKDSGGTTRTLRAPEISGKLYSPAIPADSSGNLYTPNAITQNVQLSSSNNRSSTLGAGLSWSGTGESTLNCAGLQINLENDQHATVTVYQSQDNATWGIVDEFDVPKNAGFGMTVQATASYFYVKVKNNSSGLLTYKLQSVLCPTVEALPRSLSSHGNLRTSTQEIFDSLDHEAYISPAGDLRVAQAYRLVGTTFGASVDTNFWTLTSSGTSSGAAIANDVCTLTSGSSDNGYGQLQSIRNARFISLHPLLCRINARVTATTATANTRRWGMFTVSGRTPVAGHYFELSAAGVLSVVTSGGGSTASGSFNGQVPEFVMDTNVHTYDIIVRNTKTEFIIDGVLIHTSTATTARLSTVPHLPITATSVNATSASSGVLEVWSAMIVRIGRDTTAPTSKYQSGTTTAPNHVNCKIGPGKVHGLVISAIANGSVVTLYDTTSGTGTVLWASGTITVSANQNPGIVNVSIPNGLTFFTGLTLAITTANCNVLVLYE